MLGSLLKKGSNQSRITTHCEVGINAFRVKFNVIADKVPRLILVEWDLRFMDYLLIGDGIHIKQPIDDLLGNYGLRNDLFCIVRLHLKITYLLRINHK